MLDDTHDPLGPQETSGPRRNVNDDAGIILLVEDDARLALLYATRLMAEGFAVEIAASADAALDALRRRRCDAVVLDVGLSGARDGLSVLADIRVSEALRSLPVIVFTNSDSNVDVVRAHRLGASEYLLKWRTSPLELVAAVRRLVGDRSGRWRNSDRRIQPGDCGGVDGPIPSAGNGPPPGLPPEDDAVACIDLDGLAVTRRTSSLRSSSLDRPHLVIGDALGRVIPQERANGSEP